MSSAITRSKIINAIVKERVKNPSLKLKIQDVCATVEISRQSFNRYYSDLKPYMKGERPISELIKGEDEISSNQLLCSYQSKIIELQEKLRDTEERHIKELAKIKNSITTSLMNNDLTLYDADAVRLQLQKQSLHNEKLIEKINTLQIELSKQQVRQNPESVITPLSANFEVIEEDFELLFKNYADNQDIDVFENEKESAIDRLTIKTNKLSVNGKAVVVMFMERYLCSFNKFVERYVFDSETLHLFVRLPVHSRSELKLILNKLSKQAEIKIYIPHSDSEAIIKTQRNFFFRNVPVSELQAADKSFIPSVKDGFNQVCQYRISQGD
ncbi:hypothetical protein [Acinetobacter terrae]|uniref:Uncharacterized protein n=1 Tax=Acinetobacter terrae TaxID=2731247 RepID=A0A4R0EF09_9GAMM|nr:hypothetical protein [Acinetobacter terrae]TCB54793.1 hypothetical protein E0H85_15765 [Acinetobacter terrae]